VHLSSLTLRGFKSFASATTLRFEPGITCVVGPNGSGKSNVVDAIAWVLGEQGAKALRGGKMEDVVFAGTPSRPALGRAEVVLTIDNSDGALPVDFAEVSVRRTMFRSGESEYAINGSRCRLTDVQELMSDSGIGRELHVVVGQGQLDAVLHARPEDRRGFVEEAAGVLKHRKRKEKALRKLEGMQAGLARLSDLTAELRRQLGPLGRQAEAARKAASVQAEVRDARLRLLADDLATAERALAAEARDTELVRRRHAELETALAHAREREAALTAEAAATAPRLALAQETTHALGRLAERVQGLRGLAAERARNLAAEPEPHRGRDPEELEREAAAVRERERGLAEALDADRQRLAAATVARAAAEEAAAAEERAVLAAARAAADRREGLARLAGQVASLRSGAAAADAELGRLDTALADARERARGARERAAALEGEVAALDAGELGLDERYEAAEAEVARLRERAAALREAEGEAERERSSWAARRDALALGLARDGTDALLEARGALPGLLGAVAASVRAEPGTEAAVAAALGAVADAVAVAGTPGAVAALEHLKATGAGRAALLVARPDVEAARRPAGVDLPPGARWARDLVDVDHTRPADPALRDALAAALDVALTGAVAVADLAAARELVERHPQLRAVTPDGDVLGGYAAAGGSPSAPSLLEVQAAVDEAVARSDEAADRVAAARRERERVATALGEAQAGAAAALRALHESDARMAALAEGLGQAGSAARAAEAEAERSAASRARVEAARQRDAGVLAGLEARLAAAREAPAEPERDPAERDRLVRAAADARAAEVEARLAVRTAEERVRGLAGRADGLDRAARAEREARARAERARERRREGAVVAADVRAAADLVLERLRRSVEQAAAERDAAGSARASSEAGLAAARAESAGLAAELATVTGALHRDEVARTEQRLRVEALRAKALDDHGVTPADLLAEHGPEVGVPVPPREEGGEWGSAPYDRAEQEQRLAKAERALARLGKVNPLALEEFAALQERSAFLEAQLADLKASRRDLLTVVADVDDRVQRVFAEAYADVAREFEGVFATLFPGGEGRLVLTDPDSLLTTGIEVEARPPGKRVKRLSLLSGGERSLTAIAFLVAIFRARPSPFYVLDEVEAALDDRNLSRLLELLEGLRESSQLIVITHQKRTMEIADALYGVSMRGDGVSAVISQRLRERVPATG
jgi:chromosome segregation protein